jgi:hypothetical protein
MSFSGCKADHSFGRIKVDKKQIQGVIRRQLQRLPPCVTLELMNLPKSRRLGRARCIQFYQL